MPNAHRSGAAQAARRKAKAKVTEGESSTSNFTPNGTFSFSSSFPADGSSNAPPPPAFRRPSSFSNAHTKNGATTNGSPSKQNGLGQKSNSVSFQLPSSSEDEDDELDSDSDEDDLKVMSDGPVANGHDIIVDDDSDVEIIEVADNQLTPEGRLGRAEEKKEVGNAFFKRGDFLSATRAYSQAIDLAPSNPAYYTNRAASRMASRQYRLALDDCLVAAALQIANPQERTLLRLVRCQLAIGEVTAAKPTLDQLLSLAPGNPDVSKERSRAMRIESHITNVKREILKSNWSMVLLGIDAASREVEETPRQWRIWKIEALVGKKRYDEAAGMAADLLRSNQNQPEALYFRGLCLYYSGNHPQAIAHCQSALRNDPDFVLARNLLRKVKLLDSIKDAGNEAFKKGQMQQAVEKYTEALAVDDSNENLKVTLLSNRATALHRLKRYDDALGDCTNCLALQPSHFKALRTRGRIQIATENFEAAVQDFKKAYELAPQGSADEAALQREWKEAEQKLKKSKMKDHYKTLGVSSEATEDEIKKGYRKMSLVHHPDKGGTDEKFKEVGEAYAILSDPTRRRKFDAGIDENDPHSGMQGHGMHGGMGFPGGSPFGGGVDLDDLFGGGGGFGGGFGGGGYGGRRQQNPYGF